MDEVFYFLHFTGRDGIRDLKAIGDSTKHIFVEFDTGPSQYGPGNRTEARAQQQITLGADLASVVDQDEQVIRCRFRMARWGQTGTRINIRKTDVNESPRA